MYLMYQVAPAASFVSCVHDPVSDHRLYQVFTLYTTTPHVLSSKTSALLCRQNQNKILP